MKCDSRASFLAHTFANTCLGREPKAKVPTLKLPFKFKRFKRIVHIHAISMVNGHKMTNCPNFTEMHKIFEGKNASSSFMEKW
jgi:hypothetical protein